MFPVRSSPALLPGLSAPALLALSGCAELGDLRDKVEGLTNRFVVEAVHFGVEEPEDERIADALAETDWGRGAQVTAWLADASEVGEMDTAPITGVDVRFLSSSNGGLKMRAVDSGKYQLDSDDGVDYREGEQVAISSTYGDIDRKLAVGSPTAPDIDLWTEHDQGDSLSINVSGQGYDAALINVLDIETGELTFSNLPDGAREFYELTHEGTGDTVVSIPGTAFPGEGLYAVGVAGMQVADPDSFEEVNTALSAFVAGRYRFGTVCTFADTQLCDAEDTGL